MHSESVPAAVSVATASCVLVALVFPMEALNGSASAASDTRRPGPAEVAQGYVAGEILVAPRTASPGGDAAHDQTEFRASLAALAAEVDAAVVEENEALGYARLRLRDPITSVPAAVERLARSPEVAWVEPNGFYAISACERAPLDPYCVDLADPIPENQWGAYTVGLFDLWRYGFGGDPGVVIAIVDTGIDDFAAPHPDLAPNVLATGYDTVDDDADPTDVGGASFRGHGTHVAGIAAAASNDLGIAGVAYCSSILVVRVMDCTAGDNCPGTFADIAEGIQLAAEYGAEIINLSLGGVDPSNAVRTAVQYAIQKGAIVVAASGNDGTPVLNYPAAYPEVIAVGATEPDDDVASFSNWGEELDVVAPGVDVFSTFLGDGYAAFSGTSTAAPFVSGIAALLVAENSAITQAEVETYLRAHALDLAGGNADRDGYGRLDFLRLSDWSDAPPPYPSAAHGNFAWEWLGGEASPEPSIADPLDGDHRPNIGAPDAADGYDDGVFRNSFATLPILPPHLAGSSEAFEVDLAVAVPASPRYGPEATRNLHLDIWADWDGDGTFEAGAAAEHPVVDATWDPSTWGAATHTATLPFAPVDEHILGNPLIVRSRLAYGASAGSPSGAVPFGEVEDDHFINFVEDFDFDSRVHSPGVYMTMGGWDFIPDPPPFCSNHGEGWMAVTNHPDVGSPCNGFVEGVTVMATPDMDWTEYTAAFVRFWYCHTLQSPGCSAEGDRCRVRLDRNGVKIDLGPIPEGSGTLLFDVSDLVGTDVVRVEFVEETDIQGKVFIDDVVVWAYDGEDPVAITDLGLTRAAGQRELDLAWSAPDENLFIPSPPADGTANLYDLRYREAPIGSETDWAHARPVRPSELASPAPTPGAPGAGQGVSFRAPSAFAGYSVAVRTMDETTNLSALSNAPAVANTPTLGVTVAGQGEVSGAGGEVVTVDFLLTNTGNTVDDFAITASDTEGWELLDLPGWVRLDPGTSTVYSLRVGIASGAGDGDVDSVTVLATSLASALVTGSDVELVRAEGSADVSLPVATVEAYGLRLTGAHPMGDRLTLALDLPERMPAVVAVYSVEGRRVRGLADGTFPAGRHPLLWDGTDDLGAPVASGTYFLLARTPAWSERRNVVLVR